MKFLNILKEKNNINFNVEQINALKHVYGPALILAGPGSGKTTVITARTGYLIFEIGIKPENILTLTFNKAAQIEMKHRFNNLFPSVAGKVRFSTLHSFCNQVVKDYETRQGRKLEVIEGEDIHSIKRKIIKKIYVKINGTNVNDDDLENLINEISLVKNMMISEFDNISINTKNFEEIYKEYESYKKQNYYMDFDDMLRYAYLILRKCPDILLKYKNRYKYIQVDEGQDLSKIQFEITKILISKESTNLFIVADDDQSIYGFRGAQPQHILDIEKAFKDVTIYRLENNYRSTENIVKISSQFIKTNKSRYEKIHKSTNCANKDPFHIQVKNEKEQLKFLVNKIKEKLKQNSNKDIGILYRNNISSILIANSLEQNKINFRIKQNKVTFFKHWLVQDVIAFLRFSYDQTNEEAFKRIYYKMNRYISKEIMKNISGEYEKSLLDGILNGTDIQQYQKRNIIKLKKEFKSMSKKDPLSALDYIESNFNYLKWLKEYCENTGNKYEYLEKLFLILKTISQDYLTIPIFIERLSQLELLLKQGENIKDKTTVNLTTMHSSKGLEYDTVIMVDLYNSEIPGHNSIELSKKEKCNTLLEEERRLFYVAITRAKNELYLISPQQLNEKIEEKSIFVDEVIECKNKYFKDKIEIGNIVKHKKFGTGVISKIKNNNKKNIEVDFRGIKRNLDLLICMEKGILSLE